MQVLKYLKNKEDILEVYCNHLYPSGIGHGVLYGLVNVDKPVTD